MDRKEEILQTFSDINYAYNNCTKYDTLKRMLDELTEPCEDAISRQEALVYIKALYPDMPIVDIMGARRKWLEKYAPYFECENAIESLPPVTQQPKMGNWIKEKKHHKDDFQEFDYLDVRCSECGARKRIGWTNVRHCPNCGAKMESEG